MTETHADLINQLDSIRATQWRAGIMIYAPYSNGEMKGPMFRYEYQTAADHGETRHAQEVMKELAAKHDFQIVNYEPVSIGDCWIFEIEGEVPAIPYLVPIKPPNERRTKQPR